MLVHHHLGLDNVESEAVAAPANTLHWPVAVENIVELEAAMP